jgi:hypothetical protein
MRFTHCGKFSCMRTVIRGTMASVLGIGVLMAVLSPAAALKCETSTYPCVDVRTGPRMCQTTICKNDRGEVVSINTVVVREGKDDGGASAPTRPKAPKPGVKSQ